jgi:hypothetical protein
VLTSLRGRIPVVVRSRLWLDISARSPAPRGGWVGKRLHCQVCALLTCQRGLSCGKVGQARKRLSVAARMTTNNWPSRARLLTEPGGMNVLDLTKATVICGLVAFLFYSFPILGQILVIAALSLLWLSYARKTLVGFRRR